MGESFEPEGWIHLVEDAYFLRPPGDPECLNYHYFTKTENDMPQFTIEEEIANMNEQIFDSEGFDIDFSMFRCLFNYHLVDPVDYDFLDELNNGALMDKLSRESIRRYNKDEVTEFEFVKVEKANFHACCGYMFLITFQVLDPSDKQHKTFQARVRYTTHYPTQYIFCRPKPPPEVGCDETSKEGVKDI